MFDQLFTDGVMFTLALATWLFMFILMIILLRWRDVDWLWCLAFLVPQAMLLVGYFVLWQTPDSPAVGFPIVATFNRPGAFGIWVIIVLFSIYRLKQKVRTRKLL